MQGNLIQDAVDLSDCVRHSVSLLCDMLYQTPFEEDRSASAMRISSMLIDMGLCYICNFSLRQRFMPSL